MIVDANILLYAVDQASPFHEQSRTWMEEHLNGSRRVGIPWVSSWAFARIATHPRAVTNPLSPADAWAHVHEWQQAPASWVPEPGQAHGEILRGLSVDLDLRGGLISDAVLAALCIEHGSTIISADSDFARFPMIDWINPIQT